MTKRDVPAPSVGEDPHDLFVTLTDGRFGPGHWAACKHPERPPDDMTLFLVACQVCQLMVHAALTIEPKEGSGLYDGWYRDRTQFQAMLARRRVAVIARKPDMRWRGRAARQ